MNFTERPKQIVQIFAGTLYLENFANVAGFRNSFHHLVHQLRL
jgi:hypothetical protein